MISKPRRALLIIFLILWIPGFYLLDRLVLDPHTHNGVSFESLLTAAALIGLYQATWLNKEVYRARVLLNILCLGLGSLLIGILDHFVIKSQTPLLREMILSFGAGISMGLVFLLIYWLVNRKKYEKIPEPLGRALLLARKTIQFDTGDIAKVFLLDDRLVISSISKGERPVLFEEILHSEADKVMGYPMRLKLELISREEMIINVPMARLWSRLISKLKSGSND
jgi:hypothetical protein